MVHWLDRELDGFTLVELCFIYSFLFSSSFLHLEFALLHNVLSPVIPGLHTSTLSGAAMTQTGGDSPRLVKYHGSVTTVTKHWPFTW